MSRSGCRLTGVRASGRDIERGGIGGDVQEVAETTPLRRPARAVGIAGVGEITKSPDVITLENRDFPAETVVFIAWVVGPM